MAVAELPVCWRPGQTSHHLLPFLNLSVLQSVKLGNFLFGFATKEGFDCVVISFPGPLKCSLFEFQSPSDFFLFNLWLSLHSSAAQTYTSVILTVVTPYLKRGNFSLSLIEASFYHTDSYLSHPAPNLISAERRCCPGTRVSTFCSLVSLHSQMTRNSGSTPIKQHWEIVHAEEETNNNFFLLLHFLI